MSRTITSSLILSGLVALKCGTAAAATLYLAGDSTMAENGGGSGTDGWGQYIADSVSVEVSNQAVGGRSSRSYTREGRFDAIAEVIQEGDYVVIEFGHNDGGSLTPTDNGRSVCGGDGSETCQTVYDGVSETVLTFPAYLENASKMFLDKGAHVLISSQTPNNPWESGSFVYSAPRFVELAQHAAEVANVPYVDHFSYVDAIYEQLGAETVDSYFPNDHTHTSPEGAEVVAKAFLKAVVCGGVDLAEVVTASDLPGDCL